MYMPETIFFTLGTADACKILYMTHKTRKKIKATLKFLWSVRNKGGM